MSTRDTMELKEDAIKTQYAAALALISGFDHAPRLARAMTPERLEEHAPGIGTRPRFRSTIPGICLLYTSPSPRDRQKSRMPSSA